MMMLRKRDIGHEILKGLRQMKRVETGRVVTLSPTSEIRPRTRLSQGILVVVGAVTSLFPFTLQASHGGMEYAEPLGWDSVDRKAFFLIHQVSESGRGPFVIYFDVDGSSPRRPVQVAWSKGSPRSGDSLFTSRLTSLRRRLGPMVDLPGAAIFYNTRVIKEDSVTAGRVYGFKRFKILVRDDYSGEEEFEITTLCEPVVRMIRRFRVGNEGPTFGILSFRGVPIEVGYETQVPVLLFSSSLRDRQRPPTKIEWIRWE